MRHQENFHALRKNLSIFMLSGIVTLMLHMWIHQSSVQVQIVSTERFVAEQLEWTCENNFAYQL
ncbi:hypothetical protein [Enterococcus casseliflavus]|uniref:hypothetical protein n=1 Tax=Enterococcus casseliflavus TaxID=37734 RepID=UPI00232D9BDE|nr:hypothetical protein [Enterococcus casseliflavus]MDB1690135.1 hypothetical protein [Enterococcus casseliflavus]